MPYMYLLKCSDATYYTGSTWHIYQRLHEHQNGLGSVYTKNRLPVQLVYCEWYSSIETAFHREKQVQGWSRAKKEALIFNHPEWLKVLSENHQKKKENEVTSASSATGMNSN